MIKHSPAKQLASVRDIVGWYGVVAIVGAYMLLSFKVIESNSLSYQLLNLTGAVGIIVEAAAKKDRQPVVLNLIWSAVALVAILRIIVS